MKYTFILSLLLVVSAMAQAQFSLDAQYRPRTEFLHGYKSPMTKSDQMFSLSTSQRLRLDFNYQHAKFNFGVQLQDVRIWGDQSQLVTSDGASTTLHQAWGELKITENIKLKIGRQELVYDDHRILGNVDWTQQARSHDLALLKIEKPQNYTLHFGLAVNQVQTFAYPTVNNYKSMQFLWFTKSFGTHYQLSLLALNNGIDDTTLTMPTSHPMTTYSQIVGQHSKIKFGKLNIIFNAYYQMGSDKSKYLDASVNEYEHKKMSAYNLLLEAKYKINDQWSVAGGFEMLSGQSQTDTTKDYLQSNHAFNPLYGTNHKFNGHMDYFYVGNHINSVGLNDLYASVEYTKNRLNAGGTAHYFLAASDIKDPVASTNSSIVAMKASLGMEIDLWMGWKHSDMVSIKAGLSSMMDTESMRVLKGGNPDAFNYWGWIMLEFKPNLFSSK